MSPTTRVCLLALSILAAGCQSYKGGLEIICNAPDEVEKMPEWPNLAPPDKAVFMAKMIDEKLTNGDAREAFEALAYAAPQDKALLLHKAAEEEGIDRCPLADFFARSAGLWTICQAPIKARKDPKWNQMGADERPLHVARAMQGMPLDPESINLLKVIANASAGDKATLLRKAAEEAGINDCPMVDYLAEQGESPKEAP